MRLYVIRHGITESNQGNIRQSREGYLSDEGMAEAKALSARMSKISIDAIFTSPYPRARQTADIVSGGLSNRIVQESEYLAEIRLPSEVVGKPLSDPNSKRILKWQKFHFGSSWWRYSDEETFSEYVARANAVLEHISKTGFENVVVVTHHRFIKVLVGTVLFGGALKAKQYGAIKENFYISNTGISVIEKSKKTEDRWQLMTLNDNAHVMADIA